MLKVKAVLVLYIITSSFCVHYAEVDHLCLAKMAEIIYIEGFEYSLAMTSLVPRLSYAIGSGDETRLQPLLFSRSQMQIS